MKNRLCIAILLFTVCFGILFCYGANADVLNLPSSLKTIEEDAFYGDKSLDIVVLPEGTKRINARAFANSSVKKIVLPESITSIDNTVFNGVKNLKVIAVEGSYAYNWAINKGYDVRDSLYDIIETGSYEQFSSSAHDLMQKDSGVTVSSAAYSDYASGRLIVKTSGDLPDINRFSVDTIVKDPLGYYIIQFFDAEEAFTCAEYLDSCSGVVFVEADNYIIADDIPEIQEKSTVYKSWGVTATYMDKYAADLVLRNKTNSVTVAVVDTGIYSSHSMFSGHLVSGFDFIDSDSSPQDGHGHGTHVAGTIMDCTQGLNVKIMPVRVLGTNGRGSFISVAEGIRYAAEHSCSVVNMSLGGGHSNYIDDAVQYAVNKGKIVVVAAGNDSTDTSTACPAHITQCITVSAVDQSKTRASFSNYGNAVDISAPGVDVVSAWKNGGYKSLSGTSMATPHVSAAAALLLIDDQGSIATALRNAATDLGSSGWDKYYGAGFLNVQSFIKTTYTISYNKNGGSTVPSKQSKKLGIDIKLTTTKPTKTNTVTLNDGMGGTTTKTVSATFKSWNTASDGSGTSYSPGASYSEDQSVTLYAQWTYGKLGTLPTLTRSGYSFDGWYTAASGGTKVSSSTAVKANMTIYAHWTQLETYTVSYNANGGSGAPSSQTKTKDVDLVLSTTKPTKTNTVTLNDGMGGTTSKTVSATFKNWNTNSSGTGTAYASGATYTANGSVTLYAQWTNGTLGSLPTPTRTGYTLDGWYTAASGGTKVSSSTAVTSNMTIYAHWTSTLTVTISASKTSVQPGETVTLTATASGGTGSYSYQWYYATSSTGSGTKTYTGRSISMDIPSSPTNFWYYCVVTSGSETATSSRIKFTVTPINPLSVTITASKTTLYVGDSLSITANASGGTGEYSYKWYWASSSTGSGSYTGYTERTVNLIAGEDDVGSMWYYCKVTSGSETVTSDRIMLTIYEEDDPLTVTISASKTSVQPGETVTLTATASGGTGSYSYQWYYATSSTGSGTKTYTGRSISMDIPSSPTTFWYYCVVTSGSETDTSNRIKFTVTTIDSLSVTISASKTSVQPGETVTLTATASGGTGSYSYQWYYATSSTGSGTKTYTGRSISMDIPSSPTNFWYYCVVKSGSETATSNRIKFTVY